MCTAETDYSAVIKERVQKRTYEVPASKGPDSILLKNHIGFPQISWINQLRIRLSIQRLGYNRDLSQSRFKAALTVDDPPCAGSMQ
jgi:hypothetical protein